MEVRQGVQVTLVAGIRGGWICSMGFFLVEAAGGASLKRVSRLDFWICNWLGVSSWDYFFGFLVW